MRKERLNMNSIYNYGMTNYQIRFQSKGQNYTNKVIKGLKKQYEAPKTELKQLQTKNDLCSWNGKYDHIEMNTYQPEDQYGYAHGNEVTVKDYCDKFGNLLHREYLH